MTPRTASDLVRDEAAILAGSARLQTYGLDLLLAEMHALAALLPGERHEPRADAEVEQDFDNMPV